MNNTDISTIIPVYNCEAYVEKCVRSVLAQSYLPKEIILVNDGSTDNSGKICEELALHIECVKLIDKPNGGVSSARNEGIRSALGNRIAFVDADDDLPKDAFECLTDIDNRSCGLVMGSVLSLGGETGPNYMFGKEKRYSKEKLADDMIAKNPTKLLMSGVWGKLFDTNIIWDNNLMFRTDLQNGEDGMFIADYLRHIEYAANAEDKPPVYYLRRYFNSERISAVAAFYPDFFKFHIAHSAKLYEIASQNGCINVSKGFFQRFIDTLIILLVRAFAYSDFFKKGELTKSVHEILENPLVKEAIPYYKVKFTEHSVEIPKAILNKDFNGLIEALESRAELYNEKNERKPVIKSIYR